MFAWKGARNLIVEGNGSTITLADPSSQLFHLDGRRTIVIRDLQTSHEPTPYSALEVLAVDPGGEWFEGCVLAGQPLAETRVATTSRSGFRITFSPAPNITDVEVEKTFDVGIWRHDLRKAGKLIVGKDKDRRPANGNG